MSERIEEQLSALLDDELPAGEEELLLRRLEKEPAYRAVMARYSLIGECLRGSDTGGMALALNEKLRTAIDAEDTHHLSVVRPSRRRFGVAGAAIAASVVALAVILVVNPVNESNDPASLQANATAAVTSPASADDPGQALSAEYEVASAAEPTQPARVIAPARLTGYLVSHGEYTSGMSRQINYSYVVNQAPVRVDRRADRGRSE